MVSFWATGSYARATLIWGKAKRLRDEVLSVRREAM